jgi:hypothetical protein
MLFFQVPRLPEWGIRRNDFAGVRNAVKQTTGRSNVYTDAESAVYAEAMRQPAR